MVLEYWHGKNFGDALNPIIFNRLLPDFFDNDNSTSFIGIGSIIGANMIEEAQRKIIFSSGFTSSYTSLPKIDASYDIICVRGPLSANALNINKKLSITDGAALLRDFKLEPQKKKFKVSFMPHWVSETKYPWDIICAEAGINYVSPQEDPFKVIDIILQSDIVLAEAMHFAIVADTLRVPWIPVKAYDYIDEFKWNDWAASLEMKLNFNMIPSLTRSSREAFRIVNNNFRTKLPNIFRNIVVKSYLHGYQEIYLKKKTINLLSSLIKLPPQLSKNSVFNSRVDSLSERILYVKNKYKK